MSKNLFFLIYLTTTLTPSQLATADFLITNASTTQTAWITYSAWRPASDNLPTGYRTKGWIEIEPGVSMSLEIPTYNKWIYLRVEREDGTEMKPPDYNKRKSFPFWIHPDERFTIVEAEDGDILKTFLPANELAQVPLYEFENGGSYTIPAAHQDIVRIIYFLPNNLEPLFGIDDELNKLIKATQQLFAAEMERRGYDGKSFTFEVDENGQPVIHWVDGLYADDYYATETTDKVLDELVGVFDLTQDLYLIFTDVLTEYITGEGTCGIGWNPTFEYFGFGYDEHWAIVPAFGTCLENGRAMQLVAHELGHAFGLLHDFRKGSDIFIMSYGENPHKLSKCSAEWLDVSPFFNTRSIFDDGQAVVEEPLYFNAPPDEICASFVITDPDGLHQAQLLFAYPRFSLYECIALESETEVIVDFFIPKSVAPFDDSLTLAVIDSLGNVKHQEYTFRRADLLPARLKDLAAPPISVQPVETLLLFNYPNPFNPETWIPYQLAEPANVTLTIYAVNGQVVRRLTLGHQLAGTYQRKSRAAYWDGRNSVGESVASGIYFYTFTAGDFSATRKMVIRK